jgi:hypothetical protein
MSGSILLDGQDIYAPGWMSPPAATRGHGLCPAASLAWHHSRKRALRPRLAGIKERTRLEEILERSLTSRQRCGMR